MSEKIEIRGAEINRVADAIQNVLRDLKSRILHRDPGLDLSRLIRVIVAEDYRSVLGQVSREARQQTAPGTDPDVGGVARLVHGSNGITLVLDGAYVCSAMAGKAEDVSQLVHVFHRELCRVHDETVKLKTLGTLWEKGELSGFERYFFPIAEGMWGEYFANRQAAWSVPAQSDLFLNHIAELLHAIPPAMQEDIPIYLAGNDLDGLFIKALGRVSHLLQSVAYTLGYLAGMDRQLEQISPEMRALVEKSFLAPHWDRLSEQLARMYATFGAWKSLDVYAPLQSEVLSVLASLGLTARRTEDQGVWVEVGPVAAGNTPLH